MKTFLTLPVLAIYYFCYQPVSFYPKTSKSYTDSSLVNHVLDGLVKEWPTDKFNMDETTGIQYAIDNNENYLFLAMNIPNIREQVKMMHMGMSLYIDPKGKKKENRGIEFPEKNENPDISQGVYGTGMNRQKDNQSTNEQQNKFNAKAMRQALALNLVEMKVFGFSTNQPDDQQLLLPGSANIAFSWDTANTMHIEYVIPLTMFGDKSALNQKDISIGWNVHAFEMAKRSDGTENSAENHSYSGGGGRQGYGGGGSRHYGGGNNMNQQGDREKMMAEQKFWTKYIVSLYKSKMY